MTARNDTLATLHRLKRRMGKERARYQRIWKDATSTYGKDRAYYEASVCSMAMGFIDDEIRRNKETR